MINHLRISRNAQRSVVPNQQSLVQRVADPLPQSAFFYQLQSQALTVIDTLTNRLSAQGSVVPDRRSAVHKFKILILSTCPTCSLTTYYLLLNIVNSIHR